LLGLLRAWNGHSFEKGEIVLSNALTHYGITPPTQSLEGYIQAVNRIPVLSAEEERELALRLHRDGDVDAARRLVLANLRYVVQIARGYSGYGLPQADLIQEGNIGLLKAVKRFDPAVGVRLISFAVHWIRAEIHEYILRNWRIVKVATTKAQRKLFFNLRKAKKRLGWLNAEEVQAVAKDLGVQPAEVLEMERRLASPDTAFDAQGEDDEHTAPVAYLADLRSDPERTLEEDEWAAHNHRRLAEALESLDARSRDIVQRRWIDEEKTTLQALADEYGVSAERIRQLEKAALKKLRDRLAA